MAIMGLLVAAYVVRTLMAREQKAPEVATRNMPTPVADIPVGTEITEKHLGTAPTLVSTLTPDMLANKTIIVGRVVREPLKKAVPIKANQLYGPGERPPLKLAKGMKALTIALSSATAIVDGLIKPGDYCDIQFTVNTSWSRVDDRIPFGYQLTLFKGIKVLAINRNVTQQVPESNGNTVTLEVRPGQANALILAQANGTLNLTYTPVPSPGGVEVSDADADRLTMDKLLSLPPKKPVAEQPRPPEPYIVDQYRLLRRSTIGFLPNGRVVDNWNFLGANGYGSALGTPGSIGYGAPAAPSAPAIDPNTLMPITPVAPPTPNSDPSQPAPVTPAAPLPPNPGPTVNNAPGLPLGNGTPTASVAAGTSR
jgi:Flp pilus assembly protein CpaB